MATRFIGSAVIAIFYTGNGLDEYKGIVRVSDSDAVWNFDSLYAPKSGFPSGAAYDSPEAYDAMARSAVAFASYYTSYNRGPNVPSWAPSADVADAIAHATSWAMNDKGDAVVRRKAPARVRA